MNGNPFAPGADTDAYVARLLAKLRRGGFPPAAPNAPNRGPRLCPQRTAQKRQLNGSRARRPLCSGQHPPGLRTLHNLRKDEGHHTT